MGRLISIASGKGGTGKTTTTANLAIALGKMGYKVCAVDADLTMANLSLVMGIDDASVTIHDVLADRAPITSALYATVYGNVYLVPAAIDWEHVIRADPRKLPDAIRELKPQFDFVLIDSPAGLQMDAMNAMLSGEEVVLVTNPEISCLTDTMKVGMVLRRAGLAVLGFVLNRYGATDNDIPPDVAEEVMEIPLLAVIPEDPKVRESTLHGVPVVENYPKADATRAFMELAEKIVRISGFKSRAMG
jgi:septum site-determining protein MinD